MNEEEVFVVLTDEEGYEHEFIELERMELDGTQYAVLVPLGEEEEYEEEEGELEEEEAIILRIQLDENGEEVYYDIESDEEWERVAHAWEEGPNGDNGEAKL